MFSFLSNRDQLPQLLLRLGIAIVFAYAAIDGFIHPTEWVGFLPSFVLDRFDGETALHIFAIFELSLVAWLLSGVYIRWAALFAAAMLTGIVVTNFGIFQISFRDIAIIFAALALAAMPEKEGEKVR